MAANRFLQDSMYLATDYWIDLSEEVNGVEQRFRDEVGTPIASFTGGIRLPTTNFLVPFTFTLLDDYNVRCSIEANLSNQYLLSGNTYDFGARVQYTSEPADRNDFILFHGRIEVKKTLF
jgi:hypothetical protein